MVKIGVKMFFLAIVLVSTPLIVNASGTTGSNIYGTAYFLYAFEDFQNKGQADIDDSWGISGAIGTRLHRNFAVEAEISLNPDFNINTPTRKLNLSLNQFSINLRVYLLSGKIEPYLIAGGGIVNASLTDKDFADNCNYWWCLPENNKIDNETEWMLKGGFGIDFFTSRFLAVNVSVAYIVPYGELEDLNYTIASTGIRYSF